MWHSFGYKSHFTVPTSSNDNILVDADGFSTIKIPFTNFTDLWDDATGDPIKTCAENKRYCPDERWLKNMETMSLWGEGALGDVHLQVRTIFASECATV